MLFLCKSLQIRELAGRVDAEQEQSLLMQSHQLGKQLDQQRRQLKAGGLEALNGKFTVHNHYLKFIFFDCFKYNITVRVSCLIKI